jgi:hypothetical protein
MGLNHSRILRRVRASRAWVVVEEEEEEEGFVCYQKPRRALLASSGRRRWRNFQADDAPSLPAEEEGDFPFAMYLQSQGQPCVLRRRPPPWRLCFASPR